MIPKNARSTLGIRLQSTLLGLLALCLGSFLSAATITVNTTDDDDLSNGNCTLREAIYAANYNMSRDLCLSGSAVNEDVIVFDWSLIGGPIDFAIIAIGDPLVIAGESLTINGAGGSLSLLGSAGNDVFRVAGQDPFTAFRLMNLGVSRTNSATPGRGVVFLEATETSILDLINVNISYHETANSGAGVLIANRTLQVFSIDDSYFSFNRSHNGAAIGFAFANGNDLMPEPLGSRSDTKGIDFCPPICPNEDPVWNELTRDLALFIEDSEFFGNEATTGAAMFVRAVNDRTGPGAADLNLQIRRSNFESNTGNFRAGALNIESANIGIVDLLIEDSVFKNNLNPNIASNADAGAVRLIQNQSSGVTSGYHDAVLRRNTFIGNQARLGGALAAYNRELHLVNNLFLDNIADDEAITRIIPIRNGTHRDMDIQIIGNTWLDNEVLEPTGFSALTVCPHDLAGGNLVFSGNLIYDRLQGSAAPLCFFDVDLSGVQFDLRRDNNVLAGGDEGALCQASPSDISAADVRLARESTGDDLHPERTRFFGDEPILDAWTSADCVDVDGSPLLVDLEGQRQPGGTPLNGDARTATGCDPGAFENPPGRTLTVNYIGDGEGEISLDNGLYVNLLNGSGVENYLDDDPLELIASPDNGSFFNGWGGDCAGTTPCQLVMAGNRTITADFERGTRIAVAVVGQGSVTSSPAGIDCPGICVFTLDRNGNPIMLTATPAAGWVFDGWGGDCGGTGGNVCNLSNNDDYSLNATFIEVPRYTLEVAVGGSGGGLVTSTPAGIACSGNCSNQFDENTQVTLTATPDTGMNFIAWGGACSGSGSCQVTLTEDTVVSAQFSDPGSIFEDSLEDPLP